MAFESFLTQQKRKPTRARRITYTVSMALHGGLLVAGVIWSFWHVDELSPPNVTITFMSATPPPPPPPPPKKKTAPKPKPVVITQPKINQIVQPKEVIKDEPKDDDGVEGGVEGGVAGGVVGAMPTEQPTAPRFLPPQVGSKQLLIDPQSDQYRVKLPPALSRAGMTLWAMVKMCISKDGTVHEAKIIKGADPTVDPSIVSTLKTWRYKPMTVDGRPVPFCYNVRYEISAR